MYKMLLHGCNKYYAVYLCTLSSVILKVQRTSYAALTASLLRNRLDSNDFCQNRMIIDRKTLYGGQKRLW